MLSARDLDPACVEKFWAFVEAGEYASHEKSADLSEFYRFKGPKTAGYPYMLELFSSKPAGFELADTSHLTPIPVQGDVASLSAILLDDNYETLIRRGARMLQGVSVVGAHELVLLKARAWLDLAKRKNDGEKGLSKHIKKHRNDVFRLYPILDPGDAPDIHDAVRADVGRFLAALSKEDLPMKDLGIQGVGRAEVVEDLRRFYGLE